MKKKYLMSLIKNKNKFKKIIKKINFFDKFRKKNLKIIIIYNNKIIDK